MTGVAVLVVEDEHRAEHGELPNNLRLDGFDVSTASTLTTCLEQLAAASPVIVLIDMDFPDATGVEACHQIRLRSSIPIIAIADPDSPVDAITTLEMGADDHVIRPYRPSELIARMRAALRRTAHQPPPEPLPDDPVTIDHVTLDPQGHTVIVDGQSMLLPLKEFELLHLLMVNAGRVMSRDTLIRRIWNRDIGPNTKTLDVHIKRIRQKIDHRHNGTSMIVTVRGLGYKFERSRATKSSEGSSLHLTRR